MIARIWRATAMAENAPAYRRHFEGTVLPELGGLDGHRGAYLMERAANGVVEIEVVTLWESMAAIQGFAGDDVATAVVEPEARAVLADFDDAVAHFTVAVDSVSP